MVPSMQQFYLMQLPVAVEVAGQKQTPPETH